ncbi:MAG: hypothetical protein KatS3mg015_2589 [Fimbriimonadales bacterium]|nr:MAG: hypothetical protein KatS3mg015_2589 [Fimbriimonadales bacterium]
MTAGAGSGHPGAEHLATGPTRAFGAVKQVVLDGANDTLESQMEREAMFSGQSSVPDPLSGHPCDSNFEV